VLRREIEARQDPETAPAPTHELLVKAKYGDQPARQPRPQREPRRQRDRRVPPTRTRPVTLRPTTRRCSRNVKMADRRHPANDAWEALLTAHSSLIRQFNAQDVWGDLSMKEYDVLYTLSKCPNPIRLSELNRPRPAQPAGPVPDGRPAGRTGVLVQPRDGPKGRPWRPPGTDRGRPGRSAAHRPACTAARSRRRCSPGLTPAELRQLEELCTKLTAGTTSRSE